MLRFLSPRRPAPEDPALALFTEHAELVYALCLRYLGTPERAEDAAMEVYTVLREKLPQHTVTNPRSWLHTLVRNHCLMQLRREKRDVQEQSSGALMQSEQLLHLGEEAPQAPDVRPLHRCLKTLNDEQRRCIRLFYLSQGESYRSIAERLGLSVGRVRSHLQNGRRNLRLCLERQAELRAK